MRSSPRLSPRTFNNWHSLARSRPDSKEVVVSGAVEGLVDETILRRLVQVAGGTAGSVYGKKGKAQLGRQLGGYNNAANNSLWSVLRDLDYDAPCAAELRSRLLPSPAPLMCFRIAVRAAETWLMADRQRLAMFLAVAESLIPADPESLQDPKHTLVEIARRSRKRDIRTDMVPGSSSGRSVGSAYAGRLIEFVETSWCPEAAAATSDSLMRCLKRLKSLIEIGA